MSRIGNKPIKIPEGVTIEYKDNNVKVKGPKGELDQPIHNDIHVNIEDSVVTFSRPTNQKRHKSLHGLYRAVVSNMVEGVTNGYKRELELVGVGYKAESKNNVLELNVGYSHGIFMEIPPELSVSAKTEKNKNPTVTIEGIDKHLVGQVAAKIKGIRPVEPYKGKGIRIIGEHIRKKAGKTSGK